MTVVCVRKCMSPTNVDETELRISFHTRNMNELSRHPFPQVEPVSREDLGPGPWDGCGVVVTNVK